MPFVNSTATATKLTSLRHTFSGRSFLMQFMYNFGSCKVPLAGSLFGDDLQGYVMLIEESMQELQTPSC